MSASVLLRCDAAFSGQRCPATVEIKAISAVAARDDATDIGWTTRRGRVGANSTAVRDYCPACATHLTGGARNLPR